MGLIYDTSILIAAERKRIQVERLLDVIHVDEPGPAVLSPVSVVELTHGIYRARTVEDRVRRESFLNDVVRIMTVAPMDLGIARLAGKIEGEEAAKGNTIAFEDLVIGATALHLDFAVSTLNIRHFQSMPGLRVHVPSL